MRKIKRMTKECKHNPSAHPKALGRFWGYFIHRRDSLIFKDNSAFCCRCNAPILPPAIASNPLWGVAYFILSVGSVRVLSSVIANSQHMFELFLLWLLLFVGVMLFVDRLMTSLVYAIGPWIAYCNSTHEQNEQKKRTKSVANMKIAAVELGVLVYICVDYGLPISFLCGMIAIGCTISAFVKKRKWLGVAMIVVFAIEAALCWGALYIDDIYYVKTEVVISIVVLPSLLYILWGLAIGRKIESSSVS